MDEYLVPSGFGEAELSDRKSRFIGHIWRTDTEEEAMSLIKKMREQYWDARHNVYAYIIQGGATRYSDDSEPQGTAGMPILDVLRREGVFNVTCVVTRYFGGILLGTGGLVRAYTEAAKEAVKNSKVTEIRPRRTVTCTVQYTDLGRVQYLFREAGLEPATDYQEQILLTAEVPEEQVAKLTKTITEATAGKADLQIGDMYIG